MNNTRIFVSSTCYDLAAAREDLRAMIIQMGHEPLLSEYPSFPVNPDDSAIANCRRNVREHTDVMVLIVGGKRGSLDPDTGKPVTNLEYEEAHRMGIPIYVFFYRPVLNLVRVWKKNPDADFTPDVDYPAVFAFIERIREAGGWTFSFERTEEIKDALRGQLSGLLRELLKRRASHQLDPIPEFANESQRAQQIALEKPLYWEHLLTGELLMRRMAAVRANYDDVVNGLVHVPGRQIGLFDVFEWIQAKFTDMVELAERFDPVLEKLKASWGPQGQPGDAIQIRDACNKFAKLANEIVEWEIDLRKVYPPDPLVSAVKSLRGCSSSFIAKLESIHTKLNTFLAGNPEPNSTIDLTIELEPLALESFNREMRVLEQEPWRMLGK